MTSYRKLLCSVRNSSQFASVKKEKKSENLHDKKKLSKEYKVQCGSEQRVCVDQGSPTIFPLGQIPLAAKSRSTMSEIILFYICPLGVGVEEEGSWVHIQFCFGPDAVRHSVTPAVDLDQEVRTSYHINPTSAAACLPEISCLTCNLSPEAVMFCCC